MWPIHIHRYLDTTLKISYVGAFLLAQETKNRLSYIVYTKFEMLGYHIRIPKHFWPTLGRGLCSALHITTHLGRHRLPVGPVVQVPRCHAN